MEELIKNKVYDWVDIGEGAEIDPTVRFVPYQNSKVVIGKRVKIAAGSIIYGGTSIGNDSGIGHNSIIRFNTSIGVHSVVSHLCDLEGNISIGDHSFIHSHNGIGQKTVIGNYVFVGPQCTFANDPKIIYFRKGYTQAGGKHFDLLQGPILGDGCRIGARSILFPKIRIGTHAIVGAGSVVTKNVDSYTVVFGNPATLRGMVDSEESKIIECIRNHV
jgi:acetyltransferase-like isoleucine patch superfamily enzyme